MLVEAVLRRPQAPVQLGLDYGGHPHGVLGESHHLVLVRGEVERHEVEVRDLEGLDVGEEPGDGPALRRGEGGELLPPGVEGGALDVDQVALVSGGCRQWRGGRCGDRTFGLGEERELFVVGGGGVRGGDDSVELGETIVPTLHQRGALL